jgi:hypothetical protein
MWDCDVNAKLTCLSSSMCNPALIVKERRGSIYLILALELVVLCLVFGLGSLILFWFEISNQTTTKIKIQPKTQGQRPKTKHQGQSSTHKWR